MIIKIDIDGVIRDTFTEMCAVYNELFDTNLTVDDIVSYDTAVSFPLIKNKLNIDDSNWWFFDEHGGRVFSAKPILGAIKALRSLMDAGHEVAICSHQPRKIGRLTTIKFLDENNIPYTSLHFTKDKWQVRGDFLIDDNPEFLYHSNETAKSKIGRASCRERV